MRGLLFRVVDALDHTVVVEEHEATDDNTEAVAEASAEKCREYVDRTGRTACLECRDPDGLILSTEWQAIVRVDP